MPSSPSPETDVQCFCESKYFCNQRALLGFYCQNCLVSPQLSPGRSSPQSNLLGSLKNVLHSSPHKLQSDTIPSVTVRGAAPPPRPGRKKTLTQTPNAFIVPLKYNVKGWKWKRKKSTVCAQSVGWRWQYRCHSQCQILRENVPSET